MADSSRQGRVEAKPGAVLKALRKERGWTLAEVSARTGLPVSTISKMENEKVALTFAKLTVLSKGLGVDITELFGAPPGAAPAENATRRSISHAGEGRSIATPRGSYLYTATDLLNKRMTPMVGEILATDVESYGEFQSHPGEEYVYVLEGVMELHTALYAPARLGPGDSVYFDSGMAHAYIRVSDEPCRVLSVCATAEADLLRLLEEQGAGAADRPRPRRLTPA